MKCPKHDPQVTMVVLLSHGLMTWMRTGGTPKVDTDEQNPIVNP